MSREKTAVVAVLGPTASGKTALGIQLARRFSGEIVSCDSMQIYRGLPIGTAQPTPQERAMAPHHLVDFLPLTQAFSVSDYVSLAGNVIGEIHSRGKLPVLVGGTGLYARSLLRGFSFEEGARDEELRSTLMEELAQKGPEELHRRLEELDPVSAAAIHPNNTKRVLRALEYCLLTGEAFSAQAARSKEAVSPYRSLCFVLAFRNRETLYARIDARVDKMLEQGLLEEARDVYNRMRAGEKFPTAAQAIGYKEFFPYFAGNCGLSEAAAALKQDSRRYAKRQITWFAREEGAREVYVDDFTDFAALAEYCAGSTRDFLRKEQLP